MQGMSAREYAEWRVLLGEAEPAQPTRDREQEHALAVSLMERMVR